ncbi:MAG: flagellar filament capping protein FliD [Fusobacteriota bacterium]
MGIQLGGLASGMDTQNIINQLMEIERKPLYQKQENIGEINDSKKVWNNLNSKLSSFDSAASDFKFSSTFNSKKVSSSDEDKVIATATSEASNTNYVLENVAMAKAGKVSSGDVLTLQDGVKANISGTSNIVDPNERFTQGGSTITEGSFQINGKTINVEADDTINLVITKINGSGAGVTASFDQDTNSFKLEQDTAETSSKIKFSDTDTSSFLTEMGLGDQLGQTVENGENIDYKKNISEVDAFTGVTSGFFTINGHTFELDAENDSLSDVISKINSADAGVTAFYDEDSKKVTLTSQEAGKGITLENDTGGLLENLNLMNQANDTDGTAEKSVYEGQKASFTLNGVDFTKETNKFNINGMNIDLKSSTEPGEKITLNVTADIEKPYEKIENFIEKYNDLVGYIENNNGEDGALQGDRMANNLVFNLRNKLTSPVDGVESGFNQFALIGIKAQSNTSSKLTIDKTELKEALEQDPEEIEKLFSRNQSSGEITAESVATGDGTETSFNLEKTPDTLDGLTIDAGGTIYTSDSDTNKIITSGTPGANEILLNMSTGRITFGTAPADGDDILADYSYSENNGIAGTVDEYLDNYTRYNGTIDQHIKMLDNRIENINDSMESLQMRLEMREDTLNRQFGAMETAMNESQSQGQWLSGQVANLG